MAMASNRKSAHKAADNSAHGDEGTNAAPRFRISIAAALMTCFGGLVFVGVAAVLALGFWTATVNTRALLGDKAALSMELLSVRLRSHFDSVIEGNRFLTEMIRSQKLDPGDTAKLTEHMRATMAATPQVLGMGYFFADETVIRVGRDPGQTNVSREDVTGAPQMRRALREMRASNESFWGELVRAPGVGATLINLRTPIRRDGVFVGALVSVVSVAKLSRIVGAIPDTEGLLAPFILYGEGHVLAHRAMADGQYVKSPEYPIPRIGQLGDPVLARMWDPSRRTLRLVKLAGKLEGHVVRTDDADYIFFYSRLTTYRGLPLIVGAYLLPESGLTAELERLIAAGAVAVLITLLTLAASLVVARRMSRPVRQLSIAAREIGELRLDDVRDLPRSRLRDLDEAAAAFNIMTRGLRWFETYVPRKLVQGLMAQGGASDVRSEEREVTVMFTDIVGFTTLAQAMTAADTAALLNEHFSLLAGCIEAEDGAVDKYIGDSVMAFWGPPLGEEDHARRACNAALAIRDTVEAENQRRARAGAPAIGVRIGLHSGRAIVGNIGAPGRINYTLVGDTVNVAQRLEQLIKRLDIAGERVPILVSRDFVDYLGDMPAPGSDAQTQDSDAQAQGGGAAAGDAALTPPLIPLGAHELPGRTGKMEVFSLG